jgi:hypothetical protein
MSEDGQRALFETKLITHVMKAKAAAEELSQSRQRVKRSTRLAATSSRQAARSQSTPPERGLPVSGSSSLASPDEETLALMDEAMDPGA